MKKIILLTLTFYLFTAGVALAQEKIAVVSLPAILQQCVPGKKAFSSLKKKFSKPRKEMEAKKKTLDTMQQDLQKQALVLSQEARKNKEIEFNRLVRDFQESYQKYQREFKAEEQRLSTPVVKLITTEIQKYGKKKGYGMIIDGASAGVLFAADAVDLTEEIIAAVDRAARK